MMALQKTPLQESRTDRIVEQLFKGKPAERWGRKTTGLRGYHEEA
jgi:hypothetical protein